jgi:hypothetical protein
MRGRVACAALGSAAALSLASCGGSSDATFAHSFTSGPAGIGVRYPAGWTLTTANHGYVSDPALSFDLSKVTAQEIVDLRVVEYLPPYLNPKDLSSYRARQGHFDLSAFRKGDNDWSPGKDVSFREHGRVFFAGLALPASAETRTRRQVVQILNSLQISMQGRCRPTSGVGSHAPPKEAPRPAQRAPASTTR